ncbi:DUF397 domain-containing protein [Streptomyces sp. NPDC047000]|uniref:DUF397 domain-containing protein n=1 Tax=Streptomyces sp. NPDC047000 TaxID=3155474 RepID=UPI0034116435
MIAIPELTWFKSSHSGGDGDNCVEVALRPGMVHVRDSKDKRIRPLAVAPEAWAAFTGLVTGGS